MSADTAGAALWREAALAAALLAVDPAGLGGLTLIARAGPLRARWLEQATALWPAGAPRRTVPVNVGIDRLVGGIDVAATLGAGRPVIERGLLAAAHDGILIAPSAERMEAGAAGTLAAALDSGAVKLERDGASRSDPAQFALILFDESTDGSESPPMILLERMAFRVGIEGVPAAAAAPFSVTASDIAAARDRLAATIVPEALVEAIGGAAAALGVGGMRALLFCLKATRAAAALGRRAEATREDAEAACRLVLAPRAAPPPETADPPEAPQPPPEQDKGEGENEASDPDAALEDRIIDAVRAAALGDLHRSSLRAQMRRRGALSPGKSGATFESRRRGRAVGARRGDPRDGGRLDVLATLRAAAPWARLRSAGRTDAPLQIAPQDLRIKRLKGRTVSVSIFVVDASGSAAMHRMAEAKGAVEILLQDCYTRRDEAALIAFRGAAAELRLEPTRSVVRVRRSLAHLPGGGGTPLAAGIAAAARLAERERRKGKSPVVIFLSDGQGNIALDGQPGRARAEEDALAAAQLLKSAGHRAIFLDTSPRANPRAMMISARMGAMYRPLPYADAAAVAAAVKAASGTR